MKIGSRYFFNIFPYCATSQFQPRRPISNSIKTSAILTETWCGDFILVWLSWVVLRPRSQAIIRFPSLGEACVGRISQKRFVAVSKLRAVPRIAKEGRTCMLLGAQLRPSTPLCRRSCYATPVLVIFTPDARTATRAVRSSALLASR